MIFYAVGRLIFCPFKLRIYTHSRIAANFLYKLLSNPLLELRGGGGYMSTMFPGSGAEQDFLGWRPGSRRPPREPVNAKLKSKIEALVDKKIIIHGNAQISDEDLVDLGPTEFSLDDARKYASEYLLTKTVSFIKTGNKEIAKTLCSNMNNLFNTQNPEDHLLYTNIKLNPNSLLNCINELLNCDDVLAGDTNKRQKIVLLLTKLPISAESLKIIVRHSKHYQWILDELRDISCAQKKDILLELVGAASGIQMSGSALDCIRAILPMEQLIELFNDDFPTFLCVFGSLGQHDELVKKFIHEYILEHQSAAFKKIITEFNKNSKDKRLFSATLSPLLYILGDLDGDDLLHGVSECFIPLLELSPRCSAGYAYNMLHSGLVAILQKVLLTENGRQLATELNIYTAILDTLANGANVDLECINRYIQVMNNYEPQDIFLEKMSAILFRPGSNYFFKFLDIIIKFAASTNPARQDISEIQTAVLVKMLQSPQGIKFLQSLRPNSLLVHVPDLAILVQALIDPSDVKNTIIEKLSETMLTRDLTAFELFLNSISNAPPFSASALKKLLQDLLSTERGIKFLQSLKPNSLLNFPVPNLAILVEALTDHSALKNAIIDTLSQAILTPDNSKKFRLLLGEISRANSVTALVLKKLLQDLLSTKQGREFSQACDASYVINWNLGAGGMQIDASTLEFAINLLGLTDKIQKAAQQGRKYNPLLTLAINQFDDDYNSILKHYLLNYSKTPYIWKVMKPEDTLAILAYVLRHSGDICQDEELKKEAIENIIRELLHTPQVLESIDKEFIEKIYAGRGLRNRNTIDTYFFEKLGMDLHYDATTGIQRDNITPDVLGGQIAGQIKIEFLLEKHKHKKGNQSAHDVVLAKYFNDFVADDARAQGIVVTDEANYIKLFTLFSLYHEAGGKDLKIIEMLNGDHEIKALFAQHADFKSFYDTFTQFDPIPESLQYLLAGRTAVNQQAENHIQQAVFDALAQDLNTVDDVFTQQSFTGLKALTGFLYENSAVSSLIADERIRHGIAGVIEYAHIPVAETLAAKIKNHADILDIVQRLPNTSAEYRKDKAELIKLYNVNKSLPFSLETYTTTAWQYQLTPADESVPRTMTLEKLFSLNISAKPRNILVAMADGAGAYTNHETRKITGESCGLGFKARFYRNLLAGDMFLGHPMSRLQLIENLLFNRIKEKLDASPEKDDETQFKRLLNRHLSLTSGNCAMHLTGRDADIINRFKDADDAYKKFARLTALFDLNEDELLKKLVEDFNSNPVYNFHGEAGNLEPNEIEALRTLIKIGGGDNVLQMLDDAYRPIYGERSQPAVVQKDDFQLIYDKIIEIVRAMPPLSEHKKKILPIKVQSLIRDQLNKAKSNSAGKAELWYNDMVIACEQDNLNGDIKYTRLVAEIEKLKDAVIKSGAKHGYTPAGAVVTFSPNAPGSPRGASSAAAGDDDDDYDDTAQRGATGGKRRKAS